MDIKAINKFITGIERLSEGEGITDPFFLEMRTKRCLTLCGVESVSESNGSKVECTLHEGGNISISGNGLKCVSFGNGTLEIDGVIDHLDIG